MSTCVRAPCARITELANDLWEQLDTVDNHGAVPFGFAVQNLVIVWDHLAGHRLTS